ncbi:MAG: hypothetical protein NZP74_13720 [Anaerolineales bacterium]|nr:hypothetical protein [Anaerolineales bacterium]MDW8278186.1 hypothetical protein [Anaerolineales bacterium]
MSEKTALSPVEKAVFIVQREALPVKPPSEQFAPGAPSAQTGAG